MRANGRASGPVLTSLFLFVPDHSASPDGEEKSGDVTVGEALDEEEEVDGEEEENSGGNVVLEVSLLA